ncbi:MAG: glycosyltransferase family 1 protein [Acidobacteria bacterium]|nr:glycosyltransferase family 1 protein [Acidobacteriota bacterium]
MARILIPTFGSFGDVNPYIALGLELQRRRHTPVLAMPAIFREAVEATGLAFAPVRPDLNPDDTAFARRLLDPYRGTEVLFRELLMPALPAAFDDLWAVSADADLFVTHPAALAGPLVADARRVPWLSTVLAPISFFSPRDPMVPPQVPFLFPLLTRSPLASRVFYATASALTSWWSRPVRTLRRAKGLPDRGNPVMQGQHSPWGVLAMFSAALAPPPEAWPAHTTVTGAARYNAPAAAGTDEALARFLREGEAPVVFTLGTAAVELPGDFHEVSAAAVERLGCRAVLMVGRHAHHRPAGVSARVLVVDSAPHAALFPQASAVVHQGGAGTLHQALAAGVPSLVVPHAHDQADNAARLQRLGVARVLTRRHYTVERVAETLHQMLHDTALRARATAMGARVASEDGAAAAADVIERVLRNQQR